MGSVVGEVDGRVGGDVAGVVEGTLTAGRAGPSPLGRGVKKARAVNCAGTAVVLVVVVLVVGVLVVVLVVVLADSDASVATRRDSPPPDLFASDALWRDSVSPGCGCPSLRGQSRCASRLWAAPWWGATCWPAAKWAASWWRPGFVDAAPGDALCK